MIINKKIASLLLTLCLAAGAVSGCSSGRNSSPSDEEEGTVFILGDTTFNPENEEPDVNPHNAYSGWACIRYGIGETLFRYSDSMEIEPWLATGYERTDETTWNITLREGVYFTSGRLMDGEAVKECLEHLIQVHDRARGDLDIVSITADGQNLTIQTRKPNPTFLNKLCDPYGCIIDMEAGIRDDGIVSATGPYQVRSLISGEKLDLVQNEDYWNGTPGFERIQVLTISDGDTLTMALQAGEIDAAYGMPYASYPLFQNENYTFSSCPTSRTFFLHMNFESEITRDPAVRRAIAMGIDKEGFVNRLLDGNGYPAAGPFPSTFSFGGQAVQARDYDPDGARKLLEEAGWTDTDQDGIREKNGKKLTIKWLTYPSRQELPLLAEFAQAALKEIGIEVSINNTADHNRLREDSGAWDVYASAMVTAPTGDPEYFFATHCLDSSTVNNGHYHNSRLESLASELARTFDPDSRSQLAVQMQQVILEDDAFVFCSHLQMSMISRSSVTGLMAHPCDYYEITAGLAPASSRRSE